MTVRCNPDCSDTVLIAADSLFIGSSGPFVQVAMAVLSSSPNQARCCLAPDFPTLLDEHIKCLGVIEQHSIATIFPIVLSDSNAEPLDEVRCA